MTLDLTIDASIGGRLRREGEGVLVTRVHRGCGYELFACGSPAALWRIKGTGNSRNQDGYREKYILVVAIYDTFISQHISSTDLRGRYLGE